MTETNQRDIDALRENIEETRERISGEIEAISDRLTPEHAREVARERVVDAKNKAVENVRSSARNAIDAANRVGSRLPPVVRENPVPIAMIAVGTGWLLVDVIRRRREEPQLELELETGPEEGTLVGPDVRVGEEEYGEESRLAGARERMSAMRQSARERMSSAAESARSRMHGARERLGSARESARERFGETTENVRDRAGQLATRGRESASMALSRSQDAYDRNPLMFAGLCLLGGVGLGLLLPHTERENRIFGERRERVFGRAKHMASEAKEVAIDSAKEGLRAARETAKHEAKERDLSVGG